MWTSKAFEWIRATLQPPGWPALSTLGSNRLLRTSYVWLFLVPVIAQALLISERITVGLITNEAREAIFFALPFNLYFGALFITGANLIYWKWCPTIIKEHRDFASFDNSGRQLTYLHEAFIEASPLPSSRARELYAAHPEEGRAIGIGVIEERFRKSSQRLCGYLGLPYRSDSEGPTNPGDRKDGFWYVFRYAEEAAPRWRVACFIGYGLGLMASVWIAIEGLGYVLRATIP